MSYKRREKTKKVAKNKINKKKLWDAFDNEKISKESELILVYKNHLSSEAVCLSHYNNIYKELIYIFLWKI